MADGPVASAPGMAKGGQSVRAKTAAQAQHNGAGPSQRGPEGAQEAADGPRLRVQVDTNLPGPAARRFMLLLPHTTTVQKLAGEHSASSALYQTQPQAARSSNLHRSTQAQHTQQKV